LSFYKKSRKIFAQVIAPLYRYQKKRYLRGDTGRECCREVPHGMILHQF
jgi:hypothetical protein